MTKQELESQIDALQIEMKEARYEIDLETKANGRIILDHLNNSFTWSMKNAALLINLYDELKSQINNKSFKNKVELSGLNLNMLYSVLTGVQATGIESARNYVTLLTNMGSQISGAMEEMTQKNKEIQGLYAQLEELQKAEANGEKILEAHEISE